MAEGFSVTTFVMAARLPWPDDSPPADALGALDPVALIVGGKRRDCGIRKISALGTTVRGVMTDKPGTEVAVELATGHRPAGTIDWVAGGEAGIRFNRPIDMVALLNRTLLSQPGERRTMPRVELRCHVGMKWGASLAAASLRNISARGLQVEGAGSPVADWDLPPRDTFVSLFIDGLVVPAGEVVWRKGNLAGIELMEELRWSSLMPWVREVGKRGAD
ncbi:MAG: hypothetical protein LH610_04110 [Sphingomonas bacterium]|nr:hypothetical protein [Sphingomonas bacterium]